MFALTPSADGRQIGIDALAEVDLRARAIGWLTSTFSAVSSGVPYEGHIRMGDAGQELVATAQNEAGTGVIVMGRLAERVSALPIQAQYRCGSTTRMVLWAAPCPVLVVPLGGKVDAMTIEPKMQMTGVEFPSRLANNQSPVFEAIRANAGNGNDAA
jgi:nucleotide-binding universal stress UspA family protein